jgi:FAD/FMN-containing dehydrogenase
MGGGLGLLGRRNGLTCDSMVSAQIVLADGRFIDCNTDREPDLYWALRGAGGGQLGVVTSFVFTTIAEPRVDGDHAGLRHGGDVRGAVDVAAPGDHRAVGLDGVPVSYPAAIALTSDWAAVGTSVCPEVLSPQAVTVPEVDTGAAPAAGAPTASPAPITAVATAAPTIRRTGFSKLSRCMVGFLPDEARRRRADRRPEGRRAGRGRAAVEGCTVEVVNDDPRRPPASEQSGCPIAD